jgi:hypothetical protein
MGEAAVRDLESAMAGYGVPGFDRRHPVAKSAGSLAGDCRLPGTVG